MDHLALSALAANISREEQGRTEDIGAMHLAQFILALLAVLLATAPALADKRVALVIGNGAYAKVGKLPNPSRDAAAVEGMLKAAGFAAVQRRDDLGAIAMRRALSDFSELARDADVAVVFYAGHGIELNGVNYLVPVDAILNRDIDVEDETVSLDRVSQVIGQAKRLHLIILDACRDNPFVRSMKRTIPTRSFGRGLAEINVEARDTLIAYAAKAGSTAIDGDGPNSPYTTALVKHLATPGLDVRLALGRVRDEVLRATSSRQEPFVYGSLGGSEIALVPGGPVPPSRLTLYERIEIARSHFNPAPGETHSLRLQRLKRIVTLGEIEDPQYISDHWSRGVWEGRMEGSPGPEGPNRTLVIVSVKRDGSAVGGWSVTGEGKFGPGPKIKVDDRRIFVTTLPGSQVELTRTRPDQLSGTFLSPSRTFKSRIVLDRK
jgi:hypothetical protein